MVAVPAATPPTMPDVIPTVAVPVAPLLHVPGEVVLERVVLPPTHNRAVPVIGDTAVGALTVTMRVAVAVPHALVIW